MAPRSLLLLAPLMLSLAAVPFALPAQAAEPGAFLDGAEPWVGSDCAGDVPIVVGSDAKAQSDIYSAVALAGIVGTDCIVLAGPRDGPMQAGHRARLDAAAAGGYVVGGTAAVPESKVAGREMTRLAGATRWETARRVGAQARALAGNPEAIPDVPKLRGPEVGAVLSAGSRHTCGVRTDGTLTCWGAENADDSGQTDAPAGQFRAVSSGHLHSCGVRADETVACWGKNDHAQADAPSGRFTAVSAGDVHSCGLRPDGTVVCWGSNADGLLDAPPGRFSAVSAGSLHSCGVRPDGSVDCWGANLFGQAAAPAGRFVSVDVSLLATCGLGVDQEVTCWGWDFDAEDFYAELTGPEPGTYTTVSAGGLHGCGVRTDGTLACWGDESGGVTQAPPGQFLAVSSGVSHSCGLRADRTVICWGSDDAGQLSAPPDKFGVVVRSERVPGVFLDGAEPWVGSDCAGDVPIVVGSDAKAQSDIYSAVALAGIVGTDCIVLAGPRDGPMQAGHRARLDAAAAGGYVVGGTAAVPESKVAGREMTRLAGATRWETARRVGAQARTLAAG